MLGTFIVSTVNQKILILLAKYCDEEFYERQVARDLGIAFGSANRSLNQLYAAGALRRRQKGRMYFYSIETSNPAIKEFKKLINMVLLEPLVEKLKAVSNRVVLYGSCAQGTDTSKSDIDLFVVSNNKKRSSDIISKAVFPQGFTNLRVKPVIKTPVELLQAGESEKAYLEEVERGIVLWENVANEPGI